MATTGAQLATRGWDVGDGVSGGERGEKSQVDQDKDEWEKIIRPAFVFQDLF